MTNKYTVVGVCSGNIQRSPTFEAVMGHSLKQESSDLERHVIITSAGTNVERYLTHTEEPARVIKILDAGLRYGVVPKILEQEARRYVKFQGDNTTIASLTKNDHERLRLLHQVVRPALSRRNIYYRNQALEARGIDPYKLISAKLLKPEERYDLVVAMEEESSGKVQERYNDLEQGLNTEVEKRVVDIPAGRVVVLGTEMVKVPQITTYAFLTGREPVIEDAAGGLEGALTHVDYFLDTKKEFFEQVRRGLSL